MSALAALMNAYVETKGLEQLEGSVRTAIPGVHFYRASRGSPRQPFVYQSGIIIMAQGRKRIYLNGQQLDYGPGQYLVQGVPLPLECESHSDGNQPLLGISIAVDAALLQDLVSQLQALKSGPAERPRDDCGLTADHLSATMLDATQRLLNALLSDSEAAILGASIVRELIFRVLTGPKGHILFELAQHDSHYARIAKVLVHIHRDYADTLSVEALAEQAAMSVSAFHRAFRQVTRESPLQYLKKLRLSKARELILAEGRRANEAARMVGYSSPSQFSREFKRHFKQAPRSLSA